jgi:hypothetical protein
MIHSESFLGSVNLVLILTSSPLLLRNIRSCQACHPLVSAYLSVLPHTLIDQPPTTNGCFLRYYSIDLRYSFSRHIPFEWKSSLIC